MEDLDENAKKEETQEDVIPGRSTKIMLHAPDGCFPYLTPHLLHQCFPPESWINLELGVSAQDSCITPIFGRDGNSKKPSGYRLTTFTPDPWIIAYLKIVLPAFDPFCIVPSPKNVRSGRAKSDTLNMNTMNGRIQVTNGEYATMAGQFKSTLSLFECPPKNPKDRMHALERNLEWTSAILEQQTNADVWLPVSIASIRDDADVEEMVIRICGWISECESKRLSTVCFVDWHLVKDRVQRCSLLRIFDIELPANLALAVLAADSTDSLTDAFSFGAERSRVLHIGTNLPTTLAQQYNALTIKVQEQPQPKKPRTNRDSATISEMDWFSCTSLQPCEPCFSHPWFKDAGPIDANCSCMTCQEHSRSYLYHLACSKEILVEILLFVHNLHQILEAEKQHLTS